MQNPQVFVQVEIVFACSQYNNILPKSTHGYTSKENIAQWRIYKHTDGKFLEHVTQIELLERKYFSYKKFYPENIISEK